MANLYFDYDLINEVTDMACDNIEDMLHALDVDFHRVGKLIAGPCPVHGGDNSTSWNLYPEGEEMRGFWKCRSHHCENERDSKGKLKYSKNLVGFVRGVLSRHRGKYVSFKESVDWLVCFLGYKCLSEISKPTTEVLERRKFARSVSKINISPLQKNTGWDREKLRKRLEIPANYYLDRGYSKKVLDKYDVGLYNCRKRVVVPVYDDAYKFVAGFLGRSVWNQCDKCKKWHDPDAKCPTDGSKLREAEKWLNSSFNSGNHLYNYWFACEHIQKSNTAVLVEGPGDVWKLEENNIHVGLGLFGTELSESQRVLLDRSGALSLVVLLDPDEAGQHGIQKLKKQLGRQYRMYFPNIREDVGDLNEDEITTDIKPIIEKVKHD
jgi:5S rRNA maturation endonuclease (ribonuclease M5)